MKRIIAVALLLSLACSSSPSEPDYPKPSFDESGPGTPPNCNPGYHTETQGHGGALCVPN